MSAADVYRTARTGLSRAVRSARYLSLHRKYRDFTMAPFRPYWSNIRIVNEHRHVPGCIVECGVWRGGMSAGMAEVLGPGREYFLFDSFEGLPAATEQDGPDAGKWQEDVDSPTYFDNCSAPQEFAERAMRMSGAKDFKLVKGWFDHTLPLFTPPTPIAILRLDGDWYQSTIVALECLFRHLHPAGIVIVDDYFAWDGCSRAVHDFLSRHQLAARVTQSHGVCVLTQR